MSSRGARRGGHDDGPQHEEHAVDGDGDAAAIVQHQGATQKGTKAGAQLCRADNEALCAEMYGSAYCCCVQDYACNACACSFTALSSNSACLCPL